MFSKIEKGRTKDARPYEIKLSNQLSLELRQTTGPWVLRRTKAQVQEEAMNSSNEEGNVSSVQNCSKMSQGINMENFKNKLLFL